MASSTEQVYLNTLIFTVVVKAITVLIIGILAFDVIKPYAPFLLTLEIGLVIVIFWSLYAIYSYKKSMKQTFKKLKKSVPYNVPCPDYYIRDGDDEGNQVCNNGYITPDGKIKYTFLPKNNNVEEETINKIEMDKVFENKTIDEVCSTEINNYDKYANVPWTSIRPSCSDIGDFENLQSYRQEMNDEE